MNEKDRRHNAYEESNARLTLLASMKKQCKVNEKVKRKGFLFGRVVQTNL